MSIQIYTDLKNPEYVSMNLSSLLDAYTYAVKEGNHTVASLLANLFHEESEYVRISKKSPIYSFLKVSPYVTEDEITWETIKQAYVISRLQNNIPILHSLGKVLGHWDQYILEKKERDGLFEELVNLPESVRHFILKYHDVSVYEAQKRVQKNKVVDDHQGQNPNRSIVEIGYYNDKIYKKAA